MSKVLKIKKIEVLPLLKHVILINFAVSILYCLIRLLVASDLIFDPPNIIIGDKEVDLHYSIPYIIGMILKYAVLFCVVLTAVEVIAIQVYNLISRYSGGVRIKVEECVEETEKIRGG